MTQSTSLLRETVLSEFKDPTPSHFFYVNPVILSFVVCHLSLVTCHLSFVFYAFAVCLCGLVICLRHLIIIICHLSFAICRFFICHSSLSQLILVFSFGLFLTAFVRDILFLTGFFSIPHLFKPHFLGPYFL